jgi:hypothetical protein
MLHLCVSSRPTLVPGTWLDQARAGELASFDEAAETCPNKKGNTVYTRSGALKHIHA